MVEEGKDERACVRESERVTCEYAPEKKSIDRAHALARKESNAPDGHAAPRLSLLSQWLSTKTLVVNSNERERSKRLREHRKRGR